MKSNVSHAWPPISPNSPIGGHEAMKPWDHPRAMEGRRMPPMAIGGHAWPTLLFGVWHCTYIRMLPEKTNTPRLKFQAAGSSLTPCTIFSGSLSFSSIWNGQPKLSRKLQTKVSQIILLSKLRCFLCFWNVIVTVRLRYMRFWKYPWGTK